MGKVLFPSAKDTLTIEILEAFEPGIVIEDHDGHYLTGRHAVIL
jgi:hypothetical protein